MCPLFISLECFLSFSVWGGTLIGVPVNLRMGLRGLRKEEALTLLWEPGVHGVCGIGVGKAKLTSCGCQP